MGLEEIKAENMTDEGEGGRLFEEFMLGLELCETNFNGLKRKLSFHIHLALSNIIALSRIVSFYMGH